MHISGFWCRPLLLGLVLVSMWPSPAAAQRALTGPDDHCTLGDAIANQEAYYPRGRWGGRGRFGGGSSPELATTDMCSFRTFYPAVNICFCERDEAFIGGSVWSVPTHESPYGYPAREFLELLETIDVVTKPVGLVVERFETAIKGFAGNEFINGVHVNEPALRKQAGLLFRNLPPGNYQIFHDDEHPAEGELQFQFPSNYLNFQVLRHEVAHQLPRDINLGSVGCPTETHCGDGVDNEGDDFVDCEDTHDCKFAPNCFLPRPVPGLVQAEDYKLGGEGVGYHDSDAGNNGGAYRADDVDIWSFGDQVLMAPWRAPPQWTAYDIEVAQSGYYTITARFSCGGGCPGANLVSAAIDGVEVVSFAIADTGDYTFLEDLVGLPVGGGDPAVWLDAGLHELRIHTADAAELSIDFLAFASFP